MENNTNDVITGFAVMLFALGMLVVGTSAHTVMFEVFCRLVGLSGLIIGFIIVHKNKKGSDE